MGKTESNTETEEWLTETLTNSGPHYVTRISDGDRHVEGRGYTSEEAERIASEKWSGGSGSDSESSSGGSSGSLCYLTTACVGAMSLPDDCLELTVLRGFRDDVLLQTPEGRAAVKDYYQIAPGIVKAVDSRPEAREIWRGVYTDIRKAVELVLTGDFNSAFDHYKAMTLKLRQYSG